MERTRLISSTLKSAGYNDQTNILELEFTTRTVYQYSSVPAAIYLRLLAAPSKGSFFNAFIKDRYPCRKTRS